MTILITGVAGFIGSNFVYYYLRKYKDRKIIGLDKFIITSHGGWRRMKEMVKSFFDRK